MTYAVPCSPADDLGKGVWLFVVEDGLRAVFEPIALLLDLHRDMFLIHIGIGDFPDDVPKGDELPELRLPQGDLMVKVIDESSKEITKSLSLVHGNRPCARHPD